jgi:hypothetical protein
LASLTKPVQTLIRVAMNSVKAGSSGENAEYTVDQIAQIGRDILGDCYIEYNKDCKNNQTDKTNLFIKALK